MAKDNSQSPKGRPDFMATLGLLPPYTLDDVKQAYKKKALLAHPDHGGNPQVFQEIQEAYQNALGFLSLRDDRRGWIANQMDRYLAQQGLEDRLIQLGATVKDPHTDWLERSYGDFAELTSVIDSIELPAGGDGNALIDLMVSDKNHLGSLKRVILADCGVTIDRALQLGQFHTLRHIDLCKNRLSGRVTELISTLPMLKELRIEQSSVSWWHRQKIKRQLSKR